MTRTCTCAGRSPPSADLPLRPCHRRVSRILFSLSRTQMFFPLFGRVSRRFQTPVPAVLLLFAATTPMALLTDLPALINMVGGTGARQNRRPPWLPLVRGFNRSMRSIHAARRIGLWIPSCVAQVSAGTLAVFAMVAIALLWKRYIQVGGCRTAHVSTLLDPTMPNSVV